jgi:DNA-directed RNA polymerase specialized sigma24 family protein
MASAGWQSAEFRRKLEAIVRRRVPDRDVEDIVQSTLAEAVASPSAPKDEESLQRWLLGVARHKIADLHRRSRRESFDVPEVPVEAPPHAERDLMRWAASSIKEGPDGGVADEKQTLEWMLREGDGEKLETIAKSERLPAPRVRKRVSRLRSHFRAQWKKELALLAALGVVALAVLWFVRRAPRDPVADPGVRPVPSEALPRIEPAWRLRRDALAACDRGAWDVCVSGLDRAKALDPVGDSEPRVQEARAAAEAALHPVPVAPAPTVVPSSAPSARTTPRPNPTSMQTANPWSSDIPNPSSLPWGVPSSVPAPPRRSGPLPTGGSGP